MSLILLLIGAWAVGARMLAATPLAGAEKVSAAMVIGLCALAVPIMMVSSYSITMAEVVLVAGVCVGLFIRARREARKTDDAGELLPVATPRLGTLESLFAAVVGLALGLGFVSAMAPSTHWDAVSAHLALAQDYNREGRVRVFEGNSYSGYPQLLHTLYTAAFWNGGERAAALLNWVFALLAVLACYALGKRIADRGAGLVGAALFATTPLFFDQAGSGGIDLPFTALVLVAMTLLYAWNDSRLLFYIALAGLVAGSSCGIRHTGYIVVALMAAGIVIFGRENRIGAVALFSACAIAAAAPWMIRAGVTTGNPTYPLFAGVFGTHTIADDQSTPVGGHETVRQNSIAAAILFPIDVVLRPWQYDGWSKSSGPAILVFGLAGLAARARRTMPLAGFALIGAFAFYFFQRFARYVFPFYAPMFAVTGLAAQGAGKWNRAVSIAAFAAACGGLSLGIGMTHFKFPAAFGLQTSEDYLAERVERYEAFEWLSARGDDSGTVLTLDPRTLYIDRPTYANIYSLAEIVDQPVEAQVDWLDARNIREVLYPVAYVAESPVFAYHGLDRLVQSWLEGAAGFVVAAEIETERRDGSGTETTYILHRAERR